MTALTLQPHCYSPLPLSAVALTCSRLYSFTTIFCYQNHDFPSFENPSALTVVIFIQPAINVITQSRKTKNLFTVPNGKLPTRKSNPCLLIQLHKKKGSGGCGPAAFFVPGGLTVFASSGCPVTCQVVYM